MYVYGGYQILKGMMGDFHCIDLDDSAEKFQWQQLEPKGELPGPRSKHALVAGRDRLFLVCGLSSDVRSSSQIFAYAPAANTWALLHPEGEPLPELDSFGCVYVPGAEERIVLLCGYDGRRADYLNAVYEYNITRNRVSLLFAGGSEGPAPRSGCAAATDGKSVYLFGGKDAERRMNDLWEFSLSDFRFRLMGAEGDVPPSRNGHSLEHFEGKLYLFGGIHDITWELDDLHIYSLSVQCMLCRKSDGQLSSKTRLVKFSARKLQSPNKNQRESRRRRKTGMTLSILFTTISQP